MNEFIQTNSQFDLDYDSKSAWFKTLNSKLAKNKSVIQVIYFFFILSSSKTNLIDY